MAAFGSVISLYRKQGLFTSLLHQWSEVLSRGGVHGDSLNLLYKDATCVFSECCLLELFARLSSTKFLGGFVLFSIL